MTPWALIEPTFDGVQAHQGVVVSRLKLCDDFEGCNVLRLSRGVIAELRVLVHDATTVDLGDEKTCPMCVDGAADEIQVRGWIGKRVGLRGVCEGSLVCLVGIEEC